MALMSAPISSNADCYQVVDFNKKTPVSEIKLINLTRQGVVNALYIVI